MQGEPHLATFGLIHMNGRIYDPLIGRFLQADPIIQEPYNLQNYNRYSYVMNNPLAFTDPTGYSRWTKFRDRYGKTVLAIGAAFVIGPATYNWAMGGLINSYGGAMAITGSQYATANLIASAAAGAAGGFAAGGIQGGNLNSALSGAFSGAAFGAAGTLGSATSLERLGAHAVAGCASSAASGGECGAGAAGAVTGKLFTNATTAALGGSQGAHFVGTVVGGGMGSKAAGGSFENGANSAAMGYLFNQALEEMKHRAMENSPGDKRGMLRRLYDEWVADKVAQEEAKATVVLMLKKGAIDSVKGVGLAADSASLIAKTPQGFVALSGIGTTASLLEFTLTGDSSILIGTAGGEMMSKFLVKATPPRLVAEKIGVVYGKAVEHGVQEQRAACAKDEKNC
jgi:RHS repeat-associated protein